MKPLKSLLEETPKDQPFWIEGGVLPKGGIMLLGGEAKIGKTMLLLNMMRDLSTAVRPLWGVEGFGIPNPTNVLLVDQETGERAIRERAVTLWGDTRVSERLWVSSKESELQIDTARGMANLTAMVEESQAGVVIFDPVSRLIAGQESSNDDIDRLFRSMYKLIETREGLSIVLCHHFRKPYRDASNEEYSPLDPYNFRGAAKWFDAPDAIMTAMRGPSNQGLWKLKTGWRLRHAPEPEKINLVIQENFHVVPEVASSRRIVGL